MVRRIPLKVHSNPVIGSPFLCALYFAMGYPGLDHPFHFYTVLVCAHNTHQRHGETVLDAVSADVYWLENQHDAINYGGTLFEGQETAAFLRCHW